MAFCINPSKLQCSQLISDHLSFQYRSQAWIFCMCNIIHRDIVANLICKIEESITSRVKVFVLPYHICLQFLVSNIFITADMKVLHCQIFFQTNHHHHSFSKLLIPSVTIFSGYCFMNEAEYTMCVVNGNLSCQHKHAACSAPGDHTVQQWCSLCEVGGQPPSPKKKKIWRKMGDGGQN